MPITSGRLGKVTTIWTGYPGTPWYSTHWFDVGDGSGSADYVAYVGDFWLGIADQISSTVTFSVQGAVEEIDVATGQVVGGATASDAVGVGTATGDILPPMSQGLLRLGTGYYANGRQLRGRLFIPAPVESESNGVPSSDYRAQIVQGGNSLQSSDEANGAWVVYSRRNHVAEYINAISAAPFWASLRTRRD